MEESIPDIIDTIWLDRPSAGNSQIISLSEEYTGVSAEVSSDAISNLFFFIYQKRRGYNHSHVSD